MTKYPTVAVIGSPGCGKTSLVRGARGLSFRDGYYDSTIEDVTLDSLHHGSVSHTLWVADLGGFHHMRYDTDSPYAIVSQYLDGAADAFVVVVDATDSISHQVAVTVLLWLSSARTDAPVVVVVTKCDLVADAPDHRWFAAQFPASVRSTWAVSARCDTTEVLMQPVLWAAASLQQCTSPTPKRTSVSNVERRPTPTRLSLLRRSTSLSRLSTITPRK